ncbi:MAG TPA: FkbM family methyltransferase [Vicinamibacteria bacterium]|nr:FkbM family methyltransferase [Vicinamibacteria bacterium]
MGATGAMTSYGLNWEDVRLRRAFPEEAVGFYIDVGAYDPVLASLTKHFYDRGWRGINIEPNIRGFERLCAERDRDINLNIGLSSRAGTLTFFEPSTSSHGLATFSARDAARHREAGLSFAERPVAVTTLARICEEHVRDRIDFLSIDVEGHEAEVLEGNDWSRWRPRVLVIEATEPLNAMPRSPLDVVPNHHRWEAKVLGAGYSFAAFDGLNRYYVREEDRGLAEALAAPISILDNFVPHPFLEPQLECERLRDRAEVAERQLAAARALNSASERELTEMRAEFDALAVQSEDLALRAERARRVLLTLRPQYESLRAGMADAQVACARLAREAEQARETAETECGRLVLLRDVGPLGIEFARRLRALSRRHAAVAAIAKAPLRLALRVLSGHRGQA